MLGVTSTGVLAPFLSIFVTVKLFASYCAVAESQFANLSSILTVPSVPLFVLALIVYPTVPSLFNVAFLDIFKSYCSLLGLIMISPPSPPNSTLPPSPASSADKVPLNVI